MMSEETPPPPTPVFKAKPHQPKTFWFCVHYFCHSLFSLMLGSAILGTALGFSVFFWLQSLLPTVEQFSAQVRTPSVTVQASDGTVLAAYGDIYDEFIPVSELPPYVVTAFLSVEDRRFFSHSGIDPIGLLRAAFTNYYAHRVVQGGSTLTQQLAKNILTSNGFFAVTDRSLKRKLLELMLALKLETNFSKEQILTLYLNRVYFGAGTYGIDAATRKYFGKSARDLSLFEAAVLAGLLRAPSRYSPTANPTRAVARARLVLDCMEGAQVLSPRWRELIGPWEKDFISRAAQVENGSHYFADWIYESIPSLIGPLDQDITVVTTLNMEMQRQAEQTCKQFYNDCHAEYKFSQVALIAMTADGAVLSMVGGLDYGASQFNRATSALRQPGSAFKTFVYLAAAEASIPMSTPVSDKPYEQGSWKPMNYKWKPLGEIPMSEGFIYSVNSIAIRVARMVGISNVIKTARRLGITSPLDHNLTLALGASSVTLIEMVSAYAAFANEGNITWPYGVYEIRNRKGDILFQRPAFTAPVRVIDPEPLTAVRTMMHEVVRRGTGRAANVDPRFFGKTGSSGHSDAWMIVGCCPQTEEKQEKESIADGLDLYLPPLHTILENEGCPRDIIDHSGLMLGVWIGNDARDKGMAAHSTGGRIPGRIAGALLKQYLTKKDEPTTRIQPTTDTPSSVDAFLQKHSAPTKEESEEAEAAQPSTASSISQLLGKFSDPPATAIAPAA